MIKTISIAVVALTFIITGNARASELDQGERNALREAQGGMSNAVKRIMEKLSPQDKDKFLARKNSAEQNITAACGSLDSRFPETRQCYEAVNAWWEEMKSIEAGGRIITEAEIKQLQSSGGQLRGSGNRPRRESIVGSAVATQPIIIGQGVDRPVASPALTRKKSSLSKITRSRASSQAAAAGETTNVRNK